MTDQDGKQTSGNAADQAQSDRSRAPNPLDEQLEQSMDASDPPSSTQPGGEEAEAEAHPS